MIGGNNCLLNGQGNFPIILTMMLKKIGEQQASGKAMWQPCIDIKGEVQLN